MHDSASALRRSAVLAVAAVGFLELPAQAQTTPGSYVLGGAGLSLLEDARDRGAANTTHEFDPGWTGLGAVGYAFANGLRLEGELGYRRNGVDNGPGNASAWSLMGNALYDFNTGTRFTPYVGVGVGGARLNFNNVATGGTTVDDGDTVVAYQGLAGVGYQVTTNLSVDLGYRYFTTEKPRFSSSAGTVESDYDDHAVVLGLRYQFGR